MSSGAIHEYCNVLSVCTPSPVTQAVHTLQGTHMVTRLCIRYCESDHVHYEAHPQSIVTLGGLTSAGDYICTCTMRAHPIINLYVLMVTLW